MELQFTTRSPKTKACAQCLQTKSVDDFYLSNKARCKKCLKAERSSQAGRERRRSWEYEAHRRDPRIRMRERARHRAKRDDVPFSLELADIVLPERCPVLDIPLRVSDKIHDDGSPSLDRIDPSKGYVSGNVAVISYRANAIKNNATVDELNRLIQYITQQSQTQEQ